jgi:pimeloyl-ACP methyl ester carboxylesterase
MTNIASMWHDERGAGEPVVLLHGGLTDSRCFDGNLDQLASLFRLYLPDRRGHGRTPDMPGPLTVELMARDTIAFLEDVVGGPAKLVGYSAGGTVALHVALLRPDLVESLVLVSAAFDPGGLLFKPSVGGELPEQVLDAYGEVSPDGRDHLDVVVRKIVDAVATEASPTPSELRGVTCPTLVLVGDDDLVTLEHTMAMYRALPQAQLAVVPNASHLLLVEHPGLIRDMVATFLGTQPSPTLMPIRRAHPGQHG